MATSIFDGTLWQMGLRRRPRPPLKEPLTTDVAIVGAGITGLLSAVLLQRQGFRVAVLEAAYLGDGVTGSSSAHLTEVPDIGYTQLLRVLGEDGARGFADAYHHGLSSIDRLARELGIQCDLRWAPAYRYSERLGDVEALQQEADSAQAIGRPATFTADLPAWCHASGGVRFDHQAMFNPLRFLKGLAEAFVEAGGQLYEQTRVTEYLEDDGAPVRLVTGHDISVFANHLVLATHTPINFNLVQVLVAPYQSYVMAFRTKANIEPALFWDSEIPYHYVRQADAAYERVVVVGGEDHKAGNEPDATVRYGALERWARARLPLGDVVAQWSDMVYEPADGVPYIGRAAMTKSVLIATGFSGVGLVGGAAAAVMIAGEISGHPKPWAMRFSPTRITPLASARAVLSENLDVAARWVTGRWQAPPELCPEDLAIGEGRLVTLEGHVAAIYRDELGGYGALSPTCTHLGCTVNWNAHDKTWDCPCHGGRFSLTGEVLSGPPTRPLRIYEAPPKS